MLGHSPRAAALPSAGDRGCCPRSSTSYHCHQESGRSSHTSPACCAARRSEHTFPPALQALNVSIVRGPGTFSQRLGNEQRETQRGAWGLSPAAGSPWGGAGWGAERRERGARCQGGGVRLPPSYLQAPPVQHQGQVPAAQRRAVTPHPGLPGQGLDGPMGAGLCPSAPLGPLSPLGSLWPLPLSQNLLLMQTYSEYMAFQKYLFVYI